MGAPGEEGRAGIPGPVLNCPHCEWELDDAAHCPNPDCEWVLPTGGYKPQPPIVQEKKSFGLGVVGVVGALSALAGALITLLATGIHAGELMAARRQAAAVESIAKSFSEQCNK